MSENDFLTNPELFSGMKQAIWRKKKTLNPSAQDLKIQWEILFFYLLNIGRTLQFSLEK